MFLLIVHAFFPLLRKIFLGSLAMSMSQSSVVILLPGKGLEQINSKIHSCWRHFLEKRSDKIVNVRLDMEREEYSVEGA